MDKSKIEQLIAAGRNFTRCRMDDDFVSDQDQHLPQPPLYKAPMGGAVTKLPRDFSFVGKADIPALIYARQSRRVYSCEGMSLEELSFLLWASQGVKSIRGKSYATLRTVPSGGARHAFELYIAVCNVSGLEKGAYHYLPESHSVEFIAPIDDYPAAMAEALMGQRWAGKGDAVFFFSFVPYRAEWRYGIHAHRIVMVDLGHAAQALYTAGEAIGLGTCGIGAFNEQFSNALFKLDGEEEYTVYAQPVGKYKKSDAPKELEFYAFLDEE